MKMKQTMSQNQNNQDIPLHKWERVQAELDRTRAELLVHQRSEMKLCQERDQLRAEVERLKKTHIMQLAAIAFAANSNTESTLAETSKCHPDYLTVALSDVVNAVKREIRERNQKNQWRAVADELANAHLALDLGEDSQAALAAYEKLKGEAK